MRCMGVVTDGGSGCDCSGPNVCFLGANCVSTPDNYFSPSGFSDCIPCPGASGAASECPRLQKAAKPADGSAYFNSGSGFSVFGCPLVDGLPDTATATLESGLTQLVCQCSGAGTCFMGGDCVVAPLGWAAIPGVRACQRCDSLFYTDSYLGSPTGLGPSGATSCDCTPQGFCLIGGACVGAPPGHYAPGGIT